MTGTALTADRARGGVDMKNATCIKLLLPNAFPISKTVFYNGILYKGFEAVVAVILESKSSGQYLRRVSSLCTCTQPYMSQNTPRDTRAPAKPRARQTVAHQFKPYHDLQLTLIGC